MSNFPKEKNKKGKHKKKKIKFISEGQLPMRLSVQRVSATKSEHINMQLHIFLRKEPSKGVAKITVSFFFFSILCLVIHKYMY